MMPATALERFVDAWSHWWTGQFDYMGRTSRERYVLVAGPVVLVATMFIHMSAHRDLLGSHATALITATIISSTLGLTVRRMRDAGVALFLAPLACIPGIGLLFVLTLGELPSRVEENDGR